MNQLRLLIFFCFIHHFASAQVESYSSGLNGQKFDWLLYYLDEHYVDPVNADSLTDLAIRALVTQLDPYSKYQTREEVIEQMNQDKGYSGVAVGFNHYFLRDTAIVTYVHSGGPADKAGLRRGDQLLALDGKSIIKDSKILQTKIDGKEYKTINFEILRNKQTKESISIKKALVPWLSVNAGYMIDSRIGYIKVGKFTLKTMDEFIPSLKYLQSLGMQELVLDLRGNLGGVKDQALLMADVFLSEGKLVYHTGGHNLEREEFITTSGGIWETGKVLILQNENTASASEIFIAAMQEWDRAVVLGKSTYGKGLIQQSYQLGDSSNIRITIGKYYTPTGRHLQRTGNDYDDWMTPYKEQLAANSLTSHLSVPDHLKTKTMSGREILAGPGGIIPDIYYEYIDPSDWTLINRLNKLGLLYDFTTAYVHRNRVEMLGQYNTVQAFNTDRFREAFMLKELRTYLTEKEPKILLPSNFPDNLIHQIKTWIASQLWHDNAYYEVENSDDRLLFRAIEVIKGRVHDNLGVKY